MRLNLQRHATLISAVSDAQRHHYLQLTLSLQANVPYKVTLECLSQVGLLLFYYPKLPYGANRSRARVPFSLLIRYWEGQPLVSVVSTSGLLCSYQALKRRAKHGGGLHLLI